MSSNKVLYIPWFREIRDKRSPGNKLEEYCKSEGVGFERVILPGDVDSGDDSLFTMSWVEDRVNDVLSSQRDTCKIVSYSFSAFPTHKTLLLYAEELRDRVEKVLFLHPVKDPLYSVTMMDWVFRQGEWKPRNKEYFIEWDPQGKFENLIRHWKWDAKKFQADLREHTDYIHQKYPQFLGEEHLLFDFYNAVLHNHSKCPIDTFENEQDIITYPTENIWQWQKSAARAAAKHIPKLTGEQIYKLVS